MKQRFAAVLTAFCLFLAVSGSLSAAAETAESAYGAENNGSPYAIMVDRAQNEVTVYGLDGEGRYTVPVRVMICSTGREGDETPAGTYTTSKINSLWCYMVDGSYGQYSTRIDGPYLFHSVCYRAMDPSTLMTEEYNDLGTSVSRGCVRLQTADAKWIYDNCPAGTLVTVFDGTSPSPLGKPKRLLGRIDPNDPKSGWDPTDPRAENPWPAWAAEQLPFPDVPFTVENHAYSDIVYAYEKGLIRGVTGGNYAPEMPLTRAMAVQLLATLAGAELSQASRAGLWYQPALEWAIENGVAQGVAGTVEEEFLPNALITRQELAVLFYRYETFQSGAAPQAGTALAGFTDGAGVDFFAGAAVSWALDRGLLQADSEGYIHPDGTVTRAQAAGIFRQYDRLTGENS